MAKDKDLAAIDDESVDMLQKQVKKGKARKFFLVYRGASIKTLVVFKKGPFAPKVLKAKKEGHKGEIAYGVVTGSGQNLFFQMAGNDRVAEAMKVDSVVESPPVKKTKFKEFLKDNGLDVKPSFHIITNLGDAPNPDADSEVPLAPPLPGSEVGEDEDGVTAVDGQEDKTSAEPTPQADPRQAEQFISLLRQHASAAASSLPSELGS